MLSAAPTPKFPVNATLKNPSGAGKIVYLHCAAGGRCLKAAELLKDAGYDIRPLKPGYEALLTSALKGKGAMAAQGSSGIR